MPKINPSINGKYLWRSKAVTVTELSAERAVVILPGDAGVCAVKVSELEEIPVEAGYEAHPHQLFSHDEWKELVKIRDEVERLIKLPKGITKATRQAALTFGISERQMFRYLRVYRGSPSIFSLGAAKSGRPTGIKLLGIRREQLIEECIEKYYLKLERPSIAKLHEAIEKLCVLEGLNPPCVKSISVRVRRIGLELKLRRRSGSKVAKEIIKGVPGHLMIANLLDRIEIDHTLVDVILRADTKQRKVIGRPWVTLAIDCKTRMILGFYVGFERPTAASVAACLAMAALPKESWLQEMGISGTWPAHGIPREIWVDNALEFRSEALRRGCNQHQINLNFRPVGSPEFGGMIERLIGTMMGHVHLLPGTTHSSVADRGDYDSEARATMTLSEFIPWFTEVVVTQYHLRTHRSIDMSPLKAWEIAAQECEIREPRDPLEYYASFLPGKKRVLRRTGIDLHTSNYWSEEFSPWIGQGQKVLAHYHPMNIDKVYVRLPDGRIVSADVQKLDVQNVSLTDRRDRKASFRANAKDPVLLKASAEGWLRNQGRLEEAQRQTRISKRYSNQDDDQIVIAGSEVRSLTVPTIAAVEHFSMLIED